jgi:hypothetical protein
MHVKDLNHASRKEAPAYFSAQVAALSSTGFSKLGIARHFGVALQTLNRWLEEDEAAEEAYRQGRESERHALHNMLYRLAIDEKHPASAMFLLKARHGYREGDQADQSNKVAVIFNLPGAMTADQYKTLDAVANKKDKRFEDNAD